jgi:hypothetical protein
MYEKTGPRRAHLYTHRIFALNQWESRTVRRQGVQPPVKHDLTDCGQLTGLRQSSGDGVKVGGAAAGRGRRERADIIEPSGHS